MRGSRALSACRRKRRPGRVRRGAGLGAPASPRRACGHPALSRRTLRRVARTLAAKRAGEARSTIWERTRRRGGRSPHPQDAAGGSSTFKIHRSVGRRAAAASEGVSPNLVAAVPMRPNPRVGAGVVVEIWSDRFTESIRGVAHTGSARDVQNSCQSMRGGTGFGHRLYFGHSNITFDSSNGTP